jgi:hypothetical protein
MPKAEVPNRLTRKDDVSASAWLESEANPAAELAPNVFARKEKLKTTSALRLLPPSPL